MITRIVIQRSIYAMAIIAFITISFALVRSCSLPLHLRGINQVSIQGLALGEVKIINWNNKPYIIIRLSHEIATNLNRHKSSAWEADDKTYTGGEILIYESISTYHGCGLWHAEENSEFGKNQDISWHGGFYDPCHWGRYDYAGRALRPDLGPRKKPLKNLAVPNYEINFDENYVLFKR